MINHFTVANILIITTQTDRNTDLKFNIKFKTKKVCRVKTTLDFFAIEDSKNPLFVAFNPAYIVDDDFLCILDFFSKEVDIV